MGILFIILLFVALCLCVAFGAKRGDSLWIVAASVVGCALGLSLFLLESKARKPSAMDVYQGKTTLEITYKDGVAIDSTVVFKDKK